jgi:hypothetical protein
MRYIIKKRLREKRIKRLYFSQNSTSFVSGAFEKDSRGDGERKKKKGGRGESTQGGRNGQLLHSFILQTVLTPFSLSVLIFLPISDFRSKTNN